MHIPLNEYTEKELAGLARRLLEKTPPPPILYRYRGANDYAIQEIRSHQVHVATPESMNDPFEYNAPLQIDAEMLKRAAESFYRSLENMTESEISSETSKIGHTQIKSLLEGIQGIRKNSGLVCFSESPDSNRMWGYYASSHGGICIGYDSTFHPFQLAYKVIYEDPTEPMEVMGALQTDASKFCDHISRRKGKEWDFEHEYRIPIGPLPEGHTHLLPVDPQSIVEVRLGVKIKEPFRDKVLEAIEKLPVRPHILQMSCNFEKFRLEEVEVESQGRSICSSSFLDATLI